MRRSEIPGFLLDPVQRASLSAELHTLADDIEKPAVDQYGTAGAVSRLEQARAERLRVWAREVESFES